MVQAASRSWSMMIPTVIADLPTGTTDYRQYWVQATFAVLPTASPSYDEHDELKNETGAKVSASELPIIYYKNEDT